MKVKDLNDSKMNESLKRMTLTDVNLKVDLKVFGTAWRDSI